jgi:hypothetical protein
MQEFSMEFRHSTAYNQPPDNLIDAGAFRLAVSQARHHSIRTYQI